MKKDEFKLNKDTTREIVYYKCSIPLNKSEEKRIVIINIIPSDNNSDLYYLQHSYENNKKQKEKDKIKLYYLNKIDNDTIDGILKNLEKKQMKRDKKINGKIEIISVEYKKL